MPNSWRAYRFLTGIAYIGLSPYDGTAVLELSLSLMFTFMGVLMGSKGRPGAPLQRKITDIEKSIMQTLLRVVLLDLREAWRSVAEIDFTRSISGQRTAVDARAWRPPKPSS